MKKSVLSMACAVGLAANSVTAGGLSDPVVEAPVDAPVITSAEIEDDKVAFSLMMIAFSLAVGPGALIPVVVANAGDN